MTDATSFNPDTYLNERPAAVDYNFNVTNIVLAPVPGFPSLYFEDPSCFLSIALCPTPLYAVARVPLNTLSYSAKIVSPKSQGLDKKKAVAALSALFNQLNTEPLADEKLASHEDYQLELIIRVEDAPSKLPSEENFDVYMCMVSVKVDAELYTTGSGLVWAQSEAIISTRKRMMQSAAETPDSIN